MDSGGTGTSTSSVTHQLVYLCRQHSITGAYHRSLINNTQNEGVYTTQVQMSVSTVPMQQVWPQRSQSASHKQKTIEANLVDGLHIISTGSHEVLHHRQVTKIGCHVQGCVPIIIRVKEVAPHLGSKVLSNRKMAFHGTQEKGIVSSLH